MKLTPLFLSVGLVTSLVLSAGFLFTRRTSNPVLKKRFYSWLLIAICFSTSFLLGDFYFRVLVLLIGLLMLYELTKLMNLYATGTALVLLITWVQFWNVAFFESPARLSWVLLICAGLVFLFSETLKPSQLAVGFYGMFLITIVWPTLIISPDRTLALLLTVGCFDVAGYLGGKKLARGFLNYKIFPKTSPNKTLAGFLTGTLVAGVILLCLGHFSWLGLVALSLGATLGDWLESKAKRLAGVKDAGTWLPGFGGALDRFDSMLLLAPLALFIF